MTDDRMIRRAQLELLACASAESVNGALVDWWNVWVQEIGMDVPVVDPGNLYVDAAVNYVEYQRSRSIEQIGKAIAASGAVEHTTDLPMKLIHPRLDRYRVYTIGPKKCR